MSRCSRSGGRLGRRASASSPALMKMLHLAANRATRGVNELGGVTLWVASGRCTPRSRFLRTSWLPDEAAEGREKLIAVRIGNHMASWPFQRRDSAGLLVRLSVRAGRVRHRWVGGEPA